MKLAALSALAAILLAIVPHALASEANLEGLKINQVAVELEQAQPAAETAEIKGHTDAQIQEMTWPPIERDRGVDSPVERD